VQEVVASHRGDFPPFFRPRIRVALGQAVQGATGTVGAVTGTVAGAVTNTVGAVTGTGTVGAVTNTVGAVTSTVGAVTGAAGSAATGTAGAVTGTVGAVTGTVGAAGSTGRGEANIKVCGAFLTVEFMRQGMSPDQACMKTIERLIAMTERRLLDPKGRPLFDLQFYALLKVGRFGAARACRWTYSAGLSLAASTATLALAALPSTIFTDQIEPS